MEVVLAWGTFIVPRPRPHDQEIIPPGIKFLANFLQQMIYSIMALRRKEQSCTWILGDLSADKFPHEAGFSHTRWPLQKIERHHLPYVQQRRLLGLVKQFKLLVFLRRFMGWSHDTARVLQRVQ
jgi:hypothetical protein